EDAVQGSFGFVGHLEIRPTRWFSLVFEPRLRIDFTESGRHRVIPDIGYAEFAEGPVEVRAGLQRFHWGKSNISRPTDPLGPVDQGIGFFRADRLGELALSTRLMFDPVTIDVVWNPIFRHPLYPAGSNAVGVDFGPLGSLQLGLREGWLTEDISVENMTFAARVGATFGPVDLEAMWMSGPSRLPGPLLDNLTLKDVVYPVDIVGASVAWAIDPVILRGEFAWISSGRAPIVINAAEPFPWTEPIPADYAAFTVGAELALYDFIGESDLIVIVEYMGEIRPHRDAQATFRPWQNDLALLLNWSLDDLDETRVSAGAIVDLAHADTVLSLSASRHLIADIVLSIDAVLLLEGNDDEPLRITHSLADRDSVVGRLTWSF
ncbi:MAG: hypothetical protein ACI9OJ_002728, partial [Myxococcota bacterium]